MKNDRFVLTGRYLRSVLHYWQAFSVMLLCMVLTGLLQPLLPWMLAPLLDSATDKKEFLFSPQWLPLLMLAVIVLLGAFSYGRSYLGGWLDATLQRDYRVKMSKQLLQLPVSHLQRDSSGLLTSRFMLFLPQLTGATMPVCMALVQETIKAIGYIALMFYWQWQLTLIVLLVAPLGAGIIRILGRRMKIVAGKAQQATAAGQSCLNEVIHATPVVKMAGESAAVQRLRGVFSSLRGSIIRTHVILSAGQPLTHILIAFPFAVVISYMVQELAAGNISAGEAASFLTIMLLLPTPIRIITRAMNTWEQMLVAAREVYGFLDATPEVDEGTVTCTQTRGQIDFQQVTFQYPNSEAPVLQDLSLSIRAGETVALVGRSGAGKTTLCNLLPRFYLPAQGQVLLDGREISQYTLASLRQQIALVTQKPLLFDDTVAMNVAFPDTPSGTQQQERLMQALQNAAADDFVAALPQGVDTRVGENGSLLSGGQQQRLMLARAFYRDAPIVILDEATSALDSDTESKIKTAMQRLLVGRTAIIIAHRFTTINFADRIAVLDQGKLLAIGTVEELRQTCPLFAELYNAQKLVE
ncbi:MAG: ATP-binding cassette domain-containing protein [Proteobacteria bacterium]|nr:ATP-binding cassette domain-containing protein [Pseudomonadota bacterium]